MLRRPVAARCSKGSVAIVAIAALIMSGCSGNAGTVSTSTTVARRGGFRPIVVTYPSLELEVPAGWLTLYGSSLADFERGLAGDPPHIVRTVDAAIERIYRPSLVCYATDPALLGGDAELMVAGYPPVDMTPSAVAQFRSIYEHSRQEKSTLTHVRFSTVRIGAEPAIRVDAERIATGAKVVQLFIPSLGATALVTIAIRGAAAASTEKSIVASIRVPFGPRPGR